MIQKNYKKVAILRPSWTQNITNSDTNKEYNFTFNFPFTFSTLIVVFRIVDNRSGGTGYASMTNKDNNVRHSVMVNNNYTIVLGLTSVTQTSIRIKMDNYLHRTPCTLSIDTVIAIE